MNRLMRLSLLGGLVSIFVLIAIILGCSDDIVLEPLPSLLGEYQGVYLFTQDLGSPSERTDPPYYVTWRFSDQNYWIWDANTAPLCICEPSGEYILADGVELVEREQGCAGCVFDGEKLPFGKFSLRQPENPITGQDSIVMVQIIGDIKKEVKLIPMNGN